MRLFILIFCLLFISPLIVADAYQDYIDRYSPMAVEQQKAYAIPASITLAQGLLESAAGRRSPHAATTISA